MAEYQTHPETNLVDEEYDVILVDKGGKVVSQQRHHCQIYVEKLDEGVTIEMVMIPTGKFRMGRLGFRGYDDERPPREVNIGSYLIGKYPITQEQWRAIMEVEPPYRCQGAKRPVDRISWKDAQDFCAQLSKRTGLLYRLPSEAEWEYACRAGTRTPFHYGETLTTDLANYVGEHVYEAEPQGIYRHESTDVGSFPPNAFGLHDMHGNVWEWCADDWHDDYVGAPFDGSVWESKFGSDDKVLRGGSWHEPPENCRSATRLKMNELEAEDYFGLRIAVTSLDQRQPVSLDEPNKVIKVIKKIRRILSNPTQTLLPSPWLIRRITY